MKKNLNITVLVDKWTIPPNDSDFTQEPEEPSTEYHVIQTARELGYEVSVLGLEDDITVIVNELNESRPDIVFNLTEQLGGDRSMDRNIAAVLDMLDIPYTGSGPVGLMLSRDKELSKQLLTQHRIRVPGFVCINQNQKVRIPKTLKYPLVVKPAFEDSSEGISNASLVNNENSLLERISFVHERWQQPVIIEEYIEGREFYAAVIGNKRLTVLPIRECLFDSDSSEGPQLATYRVKWNRKYREKWNIRFDFADIEKPIVENIERICKRVYRLLRIRDYGRIDLRLTPDNKLVVLETNPNADIAYGEEVAEAAEKAGISYEKLIEKILRLALRRYQ
jgi:D-alanine-D-alanine ligase